MTRDEQPIFQLLHPPSGISIQIVSPCPPVHFFSSLRSLPKRPSSTQGAASELHINMTIRRRKEFIISQTSSGPSSISIYRRGGGQRDASQGLDIALQVVAGLNGGFVAFLSQEPSILYPVAVIQSKTQAAELPFIST